MTNPPPQETFGLTSTDRTLPMALLRAREAVMDLFRPHLASHGVTEQQWRVMRVLAEMGQTEARLLAEKANILAPSLTRIMRTLESRGHMSLTRGDRDRRRILVTLTEEGRDLMRRISPGSAAIHAEIEQKVGAERIDRLLADIEDFLNALNAES